MSDALDTALQKERGFGEVSGGARYSNCEPDVEALEADTRELAGKMRFFKSDGKQGDDSKRHLLFVSTAI